MPTARPMTNDLQNHVFTFIGKFWPLHLVYKGRRANAIKLKLVGEALNVLSKILPNSDSFKENQWNCHFLSDSLLCKSKII